MDSWKDCFLSFLQFQPGMLFKSVFSFDFLPNNNRSMQEKLFQVNCCWISPASWQALHWILVGFHLKSLLFTINLLLILHAVSTRKRQMTKSNPLGGVECLKERLEQFSEEKREVLFVTHQGMWDRSTFWLNFRHTQTLSSCQGDTHTIMCGIN